MTERFTAAVAQLGNESIDVRLGGIFALERIIIDSPRDQTAIIKILSAYIRIHGKTTEKANFLGARSKDQALADVAAAAIVVAARDSSQDGSEAVDNLDLLTWTGAHLNGVDFPDSAELNYVNLTGADLRHADLSAASLDNARFTKANLASANLNFAQLTNAQLQNANLERAQIADTSFDSADLSHANLNNSLLEGAQFHRCNLTGTDLRGADLTRASFFDCDLAGADLRNANLRNADLTRVDLTRARLDGADLRGAKLSEVKLPKRANFRR
ncbi:pentapeptide repeat-containing protein [Streptomyces sp. NPDC094049]|uniref:pentapeptide repeat-containing protein n=1 Tax=Streptomyces sp. NPDC094049 TaxID=3154987 RepID=UPI00332D5C65